MDFIVMEHVLGQSLAELAAGQGLAVEGGNPVRRALAAAHEAGIIHRDLHEVLKNAA